MSEDSDDCFRDHFQAAVDLVEKFADDHQTVVDAVEDRTYEEVDIGPTSIEENIAKFEINISDLEIGGEWLSSEFEIHGYSVYNVADRRFTNDMDPERLVIAVTPDADPVRRD